MNITSKIFKCVLISGIGIALVACAPKDDMMKHA